MILSFWWNILSKWLYNLLIWFCRHLTIHTLLKIVEKMLAGKKNVHSLAPCQVQCSLFSTQNNSEPIKMHLVNELICHSEHSTRLSSILSESICYYYNRKAFQKVHPIFIESERAFIHINFVDHWKDKHKLPVQK